MSQNNLYNAHKDIPISQFASNIASGDDEYDDGAKRFSYVTGPLDFAKTYLVKLTAVNNKGKLGN